MDVWMGKWAYGYQVTEGVKLTNLITSFQQKQHPNPTINGNAHIPEDTYLC